MKHNNPFKMALPWIGAYIAPIVIALMGGHAQTLFPDALIWPYEAITAYWRGFTIAGVALMFVPAVVGFLVGWFVQAKLVKK
jgi:hypothetical protein